jgi:hypothetical protein
MAGRKRDQWTRAHEAERLSQLIYDLESAGGRYMTECLKAAERLPAEVKEEWEAAAAAGEQAKNEMVGRVKVLFELCCKEQ